MFSYVFRGHCHFFRALVLLLHLKHARNPLNLAVCHHSKHKQIGREDIVGEMEHLNTLFSRTSVCRLAEEKLWNMGYAF